MKEVFVRSLSSPSSGFVWKGSKFYVFLALFISFFPLANGQIPSRSTPRALVKEIDVRGNRAIQDDAVKGLLDIQIGDELDAASLKEDLKNVFDSGYFKDISVDKEQVDGGVKLIVNVVEKPSVGEIAFVGFEAVTSSSVQDKISVKKYTILDEKKINSDLRLIEQQYVEKGYYLARANYKVESLSSGEVKLIYQVVENNPITVAHVNLLGNAYFSDHELKSGMATREKRWTSWFSNAGTFKDEFVTRDKEYLAYIYRDNGFAEANVSAPSSQLDHSRQSVDVTYYVEEGERFKVTKISFSGDVLFTPEQFDEKMQVKSGNWFRISQFQNDLKILQDMYGDEGYAFVDVLPKTTANREKQTMELEFTFKKGEKAYFRNIVIEGNSKSRDNVIRRALRVVEGERFHATRLEKSKVNIERTGFFQEVTIQREPDVPNRSVDLKIKVKEKTTGTLSASLGASPKDKKVDFFAQANYSEANLLGKGWSSGISGQLEPNGSYTISVSATEPSLRDGPWSLGLSGSYRREVIDKTDYRPKSQARARTVGVTLGRELFVEDLRASLGYEHERETRSLLQRFEKLFVPEGDTESLIQTLSYDKTDNYLQPSEGYYTRLRHTLGTRIFDYGSLGGDHYFGRWDFQATLYVPVVFFQDYRTNFRFSFEPSYVYPVFGKPVPYWKRLKLGNTWTMKAYKDEPITPKVPLIISPSRDEVVLEEKGGNKRFYGSAEYFFPLIQEANLRMVTFYEAGSVLDDNESFKWKNVYHDVGFGFRWQTPIAPFRFDWAWPLSRGRLGESVFVFTFGNDDISSQN